MGAWDLGKEKVENDENHDNLCVFVVYMLSEMFLCDHVNIDKIRWDLANGLS